MLKAKLRIEGQPKSKIQGPKSNLWNTQLEFTAPIQDSKEVKVDQSESNPKAENSAGDLKLAKTH